MNLDNRGNILVPTDFTQVADNALAYANEFAKIMKKGVSILHVVEKKGGLFGGSKTKKETSEANYKLEKMTGDNKSASGVETDFVLKPGNIFDQIGEVAEDSKATLVVMGTHGITGMQNVTGSKALKVIVNSPVPFVVVQDKPYSGGFKNILVPIDNTTEDKQKLYWVASIGKTFNAKMHLYPLAQSDEFLQDSVNLNVSYAKNFFDKYGIPWELHESKGTKDHENETVRLAYSVNADLIALRTDPESDITDYILGPYEMKMIANDAQIPVLCVNSTKVFSGMGDVFDYSA
jgi:nucleotide-binding universal stress UspA family protein